MGTGLPNYPGTRYQERLWAQCLPVLRLLSHWGRLDKGLLLTQSPHEKLEGFANTPGPRPQSSQPSFYGPSRAESLVGVDSTNERGKVELPTW